MEHKIVNKYSDMIAEEVNRYKNEMLDYFNVREVNTNTNNNDGDHHSSSSNTTRQFYTTSLARTTYEIEGYTSNESDVTQKFGSGVDDDASTGRHSTDIRTRLRSPSYDPDQSQIQTQTFLTEDATSITENGKIPFYKSLQIPSNLVESIMFK